MLITVVTSIAFTIVVVGCLFAIVAACDWVYENYVNAVPILVIALFVLSCAWLAYFQMYIDVS